MTLEKIFSPKDLKTLSNEELIALAFDIRQRIIEVMAKNGGHLASNLGIVELTLALHKVFSAPKDKLIFDVSHQTYVHKLLTGRGNRFDKIRQYKGLCGFCDPKESEYDHFMAGHAGTALSLALGVLKTRDLDKGTEYVIPVIGDATLTCGLALEALNNIHKDLKRFIVILNDNNMSISKNVGAITHILSRLLSSPTTLKLHQEIDELVSRIPHGEALKKQGHKFSDSLKNFVSPTPFFAQFNLSYIGPIDGHNIDQLIDTLEGAKELSGPVLIHVLTNKGEGMEAAINNPISYHGVKPFDVGTGKFLPSPSNKPTFPKVFGKAVVELAEKDPDLVVVTPAMSQGSCLDELMKLHPERCLDVGIAEGHAVTFSGGLGYQNKKRVICSIYATFLQRAFDNLFHDVCIQEIPVVFAIDRGGISGPDGTTHHGIFDISFLNAMPNMLICQPRNGQVLKELLFCAHSWNRPTAIRYPNMATEEANSPLVPRLPGVGEVLIAGREVLILGLGHMVNTAIEVRERLLTVGIEATVFDPVFVKPLPEEQLVDLLMTHDKIVVIEEHSRVSGLFSILNNFLLANGHLGVETLGFGVPEAFVSHGEYEKIILSLGLDAPSIARKIAENWATRQSCNQGALS